MNKSFIKKASLAAMAGLLPISASAADVSISGWVNEEVTYYDTGIGSDIVTSSGNGNTLGTRLSFTASQELPAGLTAAAEIIFEPQVSGNTPFYSGTGVGGFDDPAIGGMNAGVTTLSENVSIAGGFGKVTVGLHSTPTDNIGVLSDPIVSLWDAIAIPYHGIFFTLESGNSLSTYMHCNNLGVGIGADCNGIYRNGIRYDLPAFQNVRVAVGHSNDDIYDISAEWAGELAGLDAALGLGYMYNSGPDQAVTAGGLDEVKLFQLQAGLHDPGTGLYGWVYYQNEDSELATGVTGSDDSDTYMFKGGIKRSWNSLGPTVVSGFYGSYNDMYGTSAVANTGETASGGAVTGSEVERIGGSVVQYFGDAFQIYAMYENFDVEVDGTGGTAGDDDELDIFTLGTVFFF